MSEEVWRVAVIQPIYPRSFMDRHGDGMGDLPGITARPDHGAPWGFDATRMSPLFCSPMKDAWRAMRRRPLVRPPQALGVPAFLHRPGSHACAGAALAADGRTLQLSPWAVFFGRPTPTHAHTTA